MAGNFDPYWEWLRIPLNEQPPNHYRLLRLAPFETNRQVIESAVNQLVERMQKLSQGNQVAHAQKILNDVAKANLCLADPQKKLEYDKQLKAKRLQSPSQNSGQATTTAQLTKSNKSSPDNGSKTAKAGSPVGKGPTDSAIRKVKVMSVLVPLMALLGAFAGSLLVWSLSSVNSDSPVALKSGSSSHTDQLASETKPDQSVKKPSFSDVANEVARDLELETETAEKSKAETATHPAIENESQIVSSSSNTKPADSTSPVSVPPPPTTNTLASKLAMNEPADSPPADSPPAPAGNGEGPKKIGNQGDTYAPDKQHLFESLLRKEILLEGTVIDFETSKSGKTNYLTFGDDRKETIFLMAKPEKVSADKLSVLKGKNIRVRGVVEREYDRIGLRIQTIEQIEVLSK